MLVCRWRGVHRVRVGLDQPHGTAARAGSDSKGSSGVEVVSEQLSSAKRSGPDILVNNPVGVATFSIHHCLFDFGTKAAMLPFLAAQAAQDKVVQSLGN